LGRFERHGDGGDSDPPQEDESPRDSIDDEWAKPGALLGDRYVVERRLGSGGMGYVVLARHSDLGEKVAIKLLLPVRALSRDAQNRLVREARAAAKIKSAHVVRIFDVISKGPGAPYLVMEYLAGETLGELLSRTGRIAVERAVEIVVQTCEALAEAHQSGTVHRDLKPNNLFLTTVRGRDFVKVLDFGIAKTRESEASNLTQSHALLASPAYASPEQLRASKTVDGRSDVWSLGVILYESLTGRLPFGGRALAEVSSEILRDSPRPPRRYRSDLPEKLEQVILRCLEKKPANRYQNVTELVLALESYAPNAARECLAHILEIGEASGHPLPEKEEQNDEPRGHRSTLTHASVTSAARNAGAERPRSRRALTALVTVAILAALAAVLFRPEQPGPAMPDDHSQAPVAATSPAVPSRTVAPEVPTSIAVPAPQGAASAARLTAAPAKRYVAPALSAARRRPERPREKTEGQAPEPTPLDALPLDDLIDGRK
jgi:eukaryotic-like serine/threonine-protein kinase